MPFILSGRATRNFIALLVLMHFVLFVDRVNLAAAASDGHRTRLCWQRQCTDERRRRRRRHIVTARLWLDPQPDGQLDDAVYGLARATAGWRRHDLLVPAGPPI